MLPHQPQFIFYSCVQKINVPRLVLLHNKYFLPQIKQKGKIRKAQVITCAVNSGLNLKWESVTDNV